MYLTVKDIIEEIKTEVIFEKVVDDLLMISIINKGGDNNILSYWRLTNVVGIPPLEIGINCENQCLASINFFIDSSYISKCESVNVDIKRGNILVDTSIFLKTNDYIDIAQNYTVHIQENKLSCFFGKGTELEQAYRTDRFEVYVNSKNNMIGFAVCDLSNEEVNMIKSL